MVFLLLHILQEKVQFCLFCDPWCRLHCHWVLCCLWLLTWGLEVLRFVQSCGGSTQGFQTAGVMAEAWSLCLAARPWVCLDGQWESPCCVFRRLIKYKHAIMQQMAWVLARLLGPLAWSCVSLCVYVSETSFLSLTCAGIICTVFLIYFHCTHERTNDHTACPPNQREAWQKKPPTWRMPPSRPCTTHWPINKSSSTVLARMDKFKWWVSGISPPQYFSESISKNVYMQTHNKIFLNSKILCHPFSQYLSDV